MQKRLIAAAASTIVVGALAAGNPAAAAPSSGPAKAYVVLMQDDPAVAYTGDLPGLAATMPAQGAKINPASSAVRAYVSHLNASHQAVLDKAKVASDLTNSFTYAANGFSVKMTDAEADRVRLQKGVLSVQEDVLKKAQTDTSPGFLGLDGPGEAWDTGATGEGVVVGVIDTGIWPEHPSFADDGTLPAPTGLAADIPCEFGDTEYNPLDKPFTCNNKLVGARDMRATYISQLGPEVYNSARDYQGHGTHTASTAAGDRNVKASIFGIDRGMVSGIAPRASIIAYSALGEQGGFGSDLAAAIDQAVADGVDVINYSIGSSSPGLTGADDIAFLFAARAGVHVATSAGNAGPGASTIGSPASVPWVTAVGASTHTRTYEATATLGNGASYTGASLTAALGKTTLVDAADAGNHLCLSDQPFTKSVEGKIVLCERGENARVDKSKAVYDAGGAGMILFNQNDAQALITDNHWVPTVHINRTMGLEIKAYIASAGASATAMLSQGEKATVKGSVMADFSSRGPVGAGASEDIIRPDITAPGVNILAGNTPTPDSGMPGQLFQAISGTSMSSPHIAGLMALVAQVHPDWSPAIVKSAIMTTSRWEDVYKENGVNRANPFDAGSGHVNPGKVADKNSIFNPGIAVDAGFYDYLSFLCGQNTGVVSADTCDALTSMGYSDQASQLNLPSMASGSVAGQVKITRTITNVSSETLKLKVSSVWPWGFSVSFSPSTLTLAPGASAPITFTVKNVKSKIGKWQWGWANISGNGYSARLPLMVKGTSIDAPAEAAGTGASGMGSIPVQFGYTGTYTVTPAGLAADKPMTDTVGQDPDQSFSPGDLGNGATLEKVTVKGASMLRLAMTQSDVTGPGAADADLDMYVFNSAGQLVGTSGSGGTEEQVDLANPADGTYYVYVHGWGTGGQTVGFTLHSWTIPMSGGSLKVTSKPGSATLASTGTVKFSWSGVPAGATQLGLLIHKNGSGEIGRTLVTVTN